MRLDIIVPRFPPAHWNFAFAMDVEGSAYSHPPLGAATLAAHTPADVTVRILDENVTPIDLTTTAPVVALSCMYIQRHRAFELARTLRALGRTVLIGGGLVHALPEECAAVADCVVHGEAEDIWAAILSDIASGTLKPKYRAPGFFDLSKAKVPRYDLFRPGDYSTGSVQTSRGCPYSCDFCDVPSIDGNRSRTKTVDQVMREVESLIALGYRSVFFVDDHFLGKRSFALALLAELGSLSKRINHRVIYYAQSTLNVAEDEPMLEALYLANFRRLFIGIESDDPVALDGVNKSHNTRMPIGDAVARIQRWNITVWAAFLAGFDTDTAGVFDRYLAFIQRAGIGMVIPGLLQAVPGTTLFDRVSAANRLVPLRNGYVGGQAGSLDSLLVSNIEPRNMAYAELLSGYRRFARALYEYDAYGDRVIKFLDSGVKPELAHASLADVWTGRAVLGRLLRYYLVDGDSERRRFFVRVIGHVMKTNLRRADEALFHLVIYKHLRQFYFMASEAAAPLAADVRRELQPIPGLSEAVGAVTVE